MSLHGHTDGQDPDTRRVLTVSSYGNRTSPVLRGKWILENILNAPPPAAAAADVPSLSEDEVGSAGLDAAATRTAPQEPHVRLVPRAHGSDGLRIGALYDAVGAWRTARWKVCDRLSGVAAGWSSFEGGEGLARTLKTSQEAFAAA